MPSDTGVAAALLSWSEAEGSSEESVVPGLALVGCAAMCAADQKNQFHRPLSVSTSLAHRVSHLWAPALLLLCTLWGLGGGGQAGGR